MKRTEYGTHAISMVNTVSNHLLVFDDDPGMCMLVEEIASSVGFLPRSVNNPDEFFQVFGDFHPSVIVLDLNLNGSDGIDHLRFIAENNSTAKILIVSGVDQRTLSSAERTGRSIGLDMLGSLKKPFDITVLEELLQGALAPDSVDIEAELPRAIEARELILHYQPKFSIDSTGNGHMFGVEALVRWQHPRMGLRFPDEFIPSAEKSGLILPLTDLVLREAMQQVVTWKGRGLDLSVGINIPARMVNDARFPDRVFAMLNEYDLEPDRLTLEITERDIMTNTETAVANLTRLRIKGIELSVDDFGTGYSSLVQLYRMPFNELKIDKSFVMDCETNQEARTIVEIITTLGHKLGMVVCAEGVETLPTWHYLHSLNCERAQGYLMSKAIPGDDIEAFARDWKLPTG
jgi:EAL domain-containing protein (putative c-di-GMP-specific phosphodiesterase class I)